MLSIETSDLLEARRARRIQFTGMATRFKIAGTTVTGKVMAVSENIDNGNLWWTVKVAPPSGYIHIPPKRY